MAGRKPLKYRPFGSYYLYFKNWLPMETLAKRVWLIKLIKSLCNIPLILLNDAIEFCRAIFAHLFFKLT